MPQMAAWLSVNGVAHINEITLGRAELVLRWMTARGYSTLVINHPVIHSVQLSLIIFPQVGAMSIGDGHDHCSGRNDEFCVTVGPAAKTAGILTEFV